MKWYGWLAILSFFALFMALLVVDSAGNDPTIVERVVVIVLVYWGMIAHIAIIAGGIKE